VMNIVKVAGVITIALIAGLLLLLIKLGAQRPLLVKDA
jgi:hypothetical protein